MRDDVINYDGSMLGDEAIQYGESVTVSVGWMDGWMDGCWMCGWMLDGWIDECMGEEVIQCGQITGGGFSQLPDREHYWSRDCHGLEESH